MFLIRTSCRVTVVTKFWWLGVLFLAIPFPRRFARSVLSSRLPLVIPNPYISLIPIIFPPIIASISAISSVVFPVSFPAIVTTVYRKQRLHDTIHSPIEKWTNLNPFYSCHLDEEGFLTCCIVFEARRNVFRGLYPYHVQPCPCCDPFCGCRSAKTFCAAFDSKQRYLPYQSKMRVSDAQETMCEGESWMRVSVSLRPGLRATK